MSAAAAAQLALFALIYQFITSHQDLNRIPGILRVGVGVGVGASMGAGAGAGAGVGVLVGLLVEAVRRHQAEVAAFK